MQIGNQMREICLGNWLCLKQKNVIELRKNVKRKIQIRGFEFQQRSFTVLSVENSIIFFVFRRVE